MRKDSGEVERAARFAWFLAHFGETKFKPIYFGDYASTRLEAVLTNYGCEVELASPRRLDHRLALPPPDNALVK